MIKPRKEVVRDELRNVADEKLCSAPEAMASTFVLVCEAKSAERLKKKPEPSSTRQSAQDHFRMEVPWETREQEAPVVDITFNDRKVVN